jgi:hypothetical protein
MRIYAHINILSSRKARNQDAKCGCTQMDMPTAHYNEDAKFYSHEDLIFASAISPTGYTQMYPNCAGAEYH